MLIAFALRIMKKCSGNAGGSMKSANSWAKKKYKGKQRALGCLKKNPTVGHIPLIKSSKGKSLG